MAKKTDYQHEPEDSSQVSFPAFVVEGEKPRGPIEKLLSLFADVRAGEGLAVLILTINVFMLLSAYYLLKTAREPLILTQGGASVKAYSSAGQAALLIVLIPLYSLVASRFNRLKLIVGLSLFFASHLLVFQALGGAGLRIGVAFFIWVGVFNVFVISQFWAFANDIYTEAQGKRLFPMIGVGAAIGALVGAQAAVWLIKNFHFTAYSLMGSAAAVLLICASLTYVVHRLEARRGEQVMNKHAEDPIEGDNGFKLVLQSRYLRLVALLIVILNLVNTTGEFILSSFALQEATRQFAGDKEAISKFIGVFYGDYLTIVNLVALLIQTFAVSRIFNYVSVRGALFVLPSIALLNYSFIALAPILGVVRGAKILENAIDYSLQNTVRHALFLPTTRAEKYKAKAAVDTFFMRFGDVLQGGIVKIGGELHISLAGFAWFNVAMTLIWLWIASRLRAEHRRMNF